MEIKRAWAMPNKQTFSIKPIKELILKYVGANKQLRIIDPFANSCCLEEEIKQHGHKYISNDIDTQFQTDFHLDAGEFLCMQDSNSADIVLFDPPYSPRQVSECYKRLEKTVTQYDTSSAYYSDFKKQIARVIKPSGVCISCGWNTNGIGKQNGFEIIEVLIVAHGGAHNDTLVVVERKV